MALVKFGAGIVQISGSISGVVHARNRSGNYIRPRTVPINPQTARQTAVRSAVSFLSTRWAATLTSVQRTAWNLYANSVAMKNRLSETIFLTGFNHYVRSNVMNRVAALTIIDDGPVIFELPAADPTLALAASESTQNLTVTYDATATWAVETGGYIFFFQGSPQNAQRNFFDGPWKHYNSIAGIDPGGPVPPDVALGSYAIAEGQHLWIYARVMRADGRLSEKFRADTFCAA